jgi:surface protein
MNVIATFLIPNKNNAAFYSSSTSDSCSLHVFNSCCGGCGAVFPNDVVLFRGAVNLYLNSDLMYPDSAKVTFGIMNCWDVSGAITDMSFLFENKNFFNEPIRCWDVSRVTNMEGMFSNANSFNQTISNWNVAKVNNMRSMFTFATRFNQAIGNWNVASVTWPVCLMVHPVSIKSLGIGKLLELLS